MSFWSVNVEEKKRNLVSLLLLCSVKETSWFSLCHLLHLFLTSFFFFRYNVPLLFNTNQSHEGFLLYLDERMKWQTFNIRISEKVGFEWLNVKVAADLIVFLIQTKTMWMNVQKMREKPSKWPAVVQRRTTLLISRLKGQNGSTGCRPQQHFLTPRCTHTHIYVYYVYTLKHTHSYI